MGIKDVGDLSLGQWWAIVTRWNKANGDGKPKAPTEAEFDLATMAARGVA